MNKAEHISKILDTFTGMKVLIVGDVMVDAYLWGKVDRISPEAPVPVVHITSEENRPGGAANVAINIKALGGIPILCSVTGSDRYGIEFSKLLESAGITPGGILQSASRKTTVKTRVIGNHHQLLRVDDESTNDLSEAEEKLLCDRILSLLDKEQPKVIILEDYDKGVFTNGVIQFITQTAATRNIPVTVDPRKKHFNTYSNVTLFKPNLSELRSGLKLESIATEKGVLQDVVKIFLDERNIKMVMVTLSESGVFIANKEKSVLLPAHIRDIADVSGAGDTVISVASMCLAAGLPMETIAGFANLAGGLVCESVGVVPIEREKLLQEAIRSLNLS
jgi:rfaE bifunctional protein kinase chain/domain